MRKRGFFLFSIIRSYKPAAYKSGYPTCQQLINMIIREGSNQQSRNSLSRRHTEARKRNVFFVHPLLHSCRSPSHPFSYLLFSFSLYLILIHLALALLFCATSAPSLLDIHSTKDALVSFLAPYCTLRIFFRCPVSPPRLCLVASIHLLILEVWRCELKSSEALAATPPTLFFSVSL